MYYYNGSRLFYEKYMNYRVLLILSSLLLANKAQAPAPVLSKQEALEQEHQRNQMLNEQEANKAKAYAKKNRRR